MCILLKSSVISSLLTTSCYKNSLQTMLWQAKNREKKLLERERERIITWWNVGKDPEEQSRSEHGGCALPCHHPLSPHKTLQQLFVVSGLCLHVSPIRNSCALLLWWNKPAAHSPRYIEISVLYHLAQRLQHRQPLFFFMSSTDIIISLISHIFWGESQLFSHFLGRAGHFLFSFNLLTRAKPT